MNDVLQQLIDMISRMIVRGERHQDYKRTVDLANTYYKLSTGKEIGELLRRYVKRESEEDFKMRCEITQAITPAMFANIKNPYYKVVRNEQIKKGIIVSQDKNVAAIQTMIDEFFGGGKNNKGLDYWFKTRKFNKSFVDPNMWIVVEWLGVEPNELPRPYPFEVSAKDAYNFSITNNEVQWLFCGQETKYRADKDPTKRLRIGHRYTYYGMDYTVVFDQADVPYLNSIHYQFAENEQIIRVGGINYLVSYYQHKIGYPPAFRIGYKTDGETDDRTYVNPLHDAMCYFEKSLKAVSEFDLTIAGHVFPQKIQFAPQCQGESREKSCKKGRTTDGAICSVCKGSGYMTHTAANDVLYIPMDSFDDPKNMMDLNNILVYKSPPIELIMFQKQYVDSLKQDAFEAVFNSQMFAHKNNTGLITATNGVKTATEIDINMQSIYDTLEAFTEKDSELFCDIVTVFALLTGEQLQNIDITHEYPADFKLKTQDMLLTDLTEANASGAPSFLRDAINMDLAELVYRSDDIGLQKYRVKRKFFPFNGKADDEIALLVSSDFVSLRDKVLYGNFESIFLDIEQETPDFYTLNGADAYDKQYELVEEKIDEYIDEINASKPQISVTPLKNASSQPAPGEVPSGTEPQDGIPSNLIATPKSYQQA